MSCFITAMRRVRWLNVSIIGALTAVGMGVVGAIAYILEDASLITRGEALVCIVAAGIGAALVGFCPLFAIDLYRSHRDGVPWGRSMRQAGLSMIELMVGMAVLAGLSVAILAAYTQVSNRQEAQALTQQLQAAAIDLVNYSRTRHIADCFVGNPADNNIALSTLVTAAANVFGDLDLGGALPEAPGGPTYPTTTPANMWYQSPTTAGTPGAATNCNANVTAVLGQPAFFTEGPRTDTSPLNAETGTAVGLDQDTTNEMKVGSRDGPALDVGLLLNPTGTTLTKLLPTTPDMPGACAGGSVVMAVGSDNISVCESAANTMTQMRGISLAWCEELTTATRDGDSVAFLMCTP